MKSYQDPDPLHGNGKATPKPKHPATSSGRNPWNRYQSGTRDRYGCCINKHGARKP